MRVLTIILLKKMWVVSCNPHFFQLLRFSGKFLLPLLLHCGKNIASSPTEPSKEPYFITGIKKVIQFFVSTEQYGF